MTASEYLKERARAEQGVALGGRAEVRAYHEGMAAALLYVAGDLRHAAPLMAHLANYRGTAASRAHEGMRAGTLLAEAVVDFAKTAVRA